MMYDYSNRYDNINSPGERKDNIANMNDQKQSLINSYEGFIRGNMFEELYKPYLQAEPFNLRPQTEKEALLNRIREYSFALVDLNLYLDTHPNDAEKIKIYNQYLNELKQITNNYEAMFGPLTLSSEALNSYPWAWISGPWPWEGV